MSWTDEEIDNLFQESAKAQTFEYSNAYFSEVEAMLPVNKKGKDFLWMGTALLFIAALTTGYFVNNTNDTTFNGTNGQLANLELNNQKETARSTTKVDIEQDKSASTDKALANDQITGTDAKQTSSATLVDAETTQKVYTSSKQKALSKLMANLNSKKNQDQVGLLTKIDASSGDSDLNGIAQNGSLVPLIDLKADTKVKNQTDLNVNRAPVTASLAVNGVNQLNQELDRNVCPTALIPVLSDLHPKAAFYVELNAGMSQSFLTSSALTSTSYGGGIGIESYLGNFNLTTGLNFKVSDHKELFLSPEGVEKIYGFGSTPAARNTYDFEQLYTFELPISLGYNFGKHNVNIGVRPSFSYGAKINEQEFIGEELTRSNKQSYLINEAVNRFGLKPTLGYSYHINKWTIGANIGVQLMQTVDEGYFNGEINQFPIDGQIYFRRTIRLRK